MSTAHIIPTRKQALTFGLKSKLLKLKRLYKNLTENTLRRHILRQHPPLNYKEIAHSYSSLWGKEDPSETDLTAGKIQNLRAACKALNGALIPANETFSFWKQIGKTTHRKGYVIGRELREGCIVPTIGGGLCQLSNALYDAALKANLTILERHAHSKVIAGSLSEINRDATVFWNYIDLRFSYKYDLHIEAYLSKDQLIVIFRSTNKTISENKSTQESIIAPKIGNCFSCEISSCFRNKPQTPDTIRFGKTAALLDATTPEFKKFIKQRLSPQDYLLSPTSLKQFTSYQWERNIQIKSNHANTLTIQRAIKLRLSPKQGKFLQTTLLHFDKKIAELYASKIDYAVSHLIISINLLPHLWKSGILGGRTFDVLAHRHPIGFIQEQLNQASKNHPDSPTLNDFRSEKNIISLEKEALSHANKIITPHTSIANQFNNSQLLNWVTPKHTSSVQRSKNPSKIFFPSSPLGRKGIYETVEALEGTNIELLILGTANEANNCPLHLIKHKQSTLSEITDCDLVILPAYIEHNPRILIQSLSLGIPVIATKACGLPKQKNLTLIGHPNDIKREIQAFLT